MKHFMYVSLLASLLYCSVTFVPSLCAKSCVISGISTDLNLETEDFAIVVAQLSTKFLNDFAQIKPYTKKSVLENYDLVGNSSFEDARIILLADYHYSSDLVMHNHRVIHDLAKLGDVVLVEGAPEGSLIDGALLYMICMLKAYKFAEEKIIEEASVLPLILHGCKSSLGKNIPLSHARCYGWENIELRQDVDKKFKDAETESDIEKIVSSNDIKNRNKHFIKALKKHKGRIFAGIGMSHLPLEKWFLSIPEQTAALKGYLEKEKYVILVRKGLIEELSY